MTVDALAITTNTAKAIEDLNAHNHEAGGIGEQIGTNGLKDGAITEGKMATGAVTTEKIGAKAVTTEKLSAELAALVLAGGASGANAPLCYKVDAHFYASTQTGIKSPSKMWVNINDGGCVLSSQKDIAVTDHAAWDTKSAAWTASTAYKVDDVVYIAANPGLLYRCTTAGTSSTLTPSFPTTIGGTYNDGNVVWICQLDFTYSPTTTVRAASTAYALGAMIRLSATNGFVYKCTTAGTTAATAPTFPTVVGSTVTDGTAVWTCMLGSNRAGGDFYIYACTPTTGIVPEIVLSDNSTIPLKYTASNSRKIGGFHCLCADVGVINGHMLSGYVAGDVLPASVWDLSHRPKSEPEGMVYIDGLDIWVDIYLASNTGSGTSKKLISTYGGAIADGTSSPTYCYFDFVETLGKQNKRLLFQSEYECATQGQPQAVAIYGSADPSTTGGHKSTGNIRLISNFGVEDGCGVMWTWVQGYFYTSDYVCGLVGGGWGNGSSCGSRCLSSSLPSALSANCGSRGASEPSRGEI